METTTAPTTTTTPQVGDRFTVDRPDWVFVGTVVAVEQETTVAGADENGVRWETSPNRFRVTVEGTGEFTERFTTTVVV